MSNLYFRKKIMLLIENAIKLYQCINFLSTRYETLNIILKLILVSRGALLLVIILKSNLT